MILIAITYGIAIAIVGAAAFNFGVKSPRQAKLGSFYYLVPIFIGASIWLLVIFMLLGLHVDPIVLIVVALVLGLIIMASSYGMNLNTGRRVLPNIGLIVDERIKEEFAHSFAIYYTVVVGLLGLLLVCTPPLIAAILPSTGIVDFGALPAIDISSAFQIWTKVASIDCSNTALSTRAVCAFATKSAGIAAILCPAAIAVVFVVVVIRIITGRKEDVSTALSALLEFLRKLK